MIIQANLPNGFDLGISLRQIPVFLQNLIPDLVRRIGMGAYSGINPVNAPGQGAGSLGGGQITAGVHEKPNSLLREPGQELLPVQVKPAVIQMGMGIKIAWFPPLNLKNLNIYLTAKVAALQDGKFFALWV